MSAKNQMGDELEICKRCGSKYNAWEQEPPEDATFHWVPSCPYCGSKITDTAVNRTWLEIAGSNMELHDDEKVDDRIDELHVQARLYHGKLVGLTVEELVEIAQFFDDRVSEGRRWGPEFARDVAFAVRKQAREQMMGV